MSRETVGDEVRSGDLTVEGTVKTPAVNHPDATSGGLAVDSSGDVSVTGSVQVAESIVTNRARIVLSAPDDGTRYRHLLGANLDVDASGTYTKLATNISGAGWVFDSANGVGLHGVLSYVSAADDNTSTATPVERMRIDSSGNVGIGTSSPQTKLSVSGDLGVGANAGVFANLYYNGGFKYLGDGYGALFKVSNENGDLGLYAAPNNVSGAGAAATLTERFRVSNAGLIAGSGTSLGAWTAYTPTLGGTGWALGDGTANFAYAQIGKVVHARGQLQFGSTSTFGTGQLTVGLPVSANSSSYHRPVVSVLCYDVSAGSYFAGTGFVSGNAIYLSALNSSSGQLVNLVNTSPFTWASVDFIRISVTYEAA